MSGAGQFRPAFASAARTASPTPAVLSAGPTQVGAHIIINVTADPAAASVVFHVEGFDHTSEHWYPILTSAAIAAVGATVLRIYPDATAAANTHVNDYLPPVWRIRPVHADSDSITYSVGVNMLGD
jgi:hypothetical protein